MSSIPLDDGEVRTLLMLVMQYQKAMARAQMAEELNTEYMQQLRDKYGLGPEWVCSDALIGFVREVGE